jgi:hypothetical protein
MYVKFLKNTVADREPRKKGTCAEISEKDARFLINIGAAEKAEKPKPKAKAKAAPTNRQVSEDELETR